MQVSPRTRGRSDRSRIFASGSRVNRLSYGTYSDSLVNSPGTSMSATTLAPPHPRDAFREVNAKEYWLIGCDGKRYASVKPGYLGGHRAQKLYGRLDCPSAQKAISRGGYAKYRVFFANEKVAIIAGYRPCARCLPNRYAVWKDLASSGISSCELRSTLLGRFELDP